jgi:hypothetical protein
MSRRLRHSRPFLLRSHIRAIVQLWPTSRTSAPATSDESAQTLMFALRFEGRRRVHQADEFMTRITADRLVKHLETSGFVVMKRPPGAQPTTAGMPPSGGRA